MSNWSLDPCVYILSAALYEDGEIREASELMRSFLLPGQRKIHRRDESPGRRLKLVDALGSSALRLGEPEYLKRLDPLVRVIESESAR